MTRSLKYALVAAAGLFLAAFVAIALARIDYPFQLEWQEGGMLEHARRWTEGKPIYAAPTLEFVAFPYPPLYHALGALLVALFGPELAVLRGLSLAGALASFAALYAIGRSGSGSRAGGVLAAGLFAACYRFAGAWLDVARVDSLCLAFALWGVFALLRGSGPRAAALAGLLVALASLAKQSALPVGAGLAVAAFARDRRQGLAFLAGFLGPLVAGSVALDLASGGWYRWYVFELLASHPLHPPMLAGYWVELGRLAIAFALGLAPLARPLRGGGALLGAVLGLLAAGWLGRAHIGGYDNTLLPACAAAAAVFGTALGRRLALPGRGASLAAAAGFVQLALLVYDPRAQLPTDADRRAGERVVAELAAFEGEVLVPGHGYLARAAGKRAFAHDMAIRDVLRGPRRPEIGAFVAELEQALAERRFAAVVLDDRVWEEELPALGRSYRLARHLFGPGSEGVFVPVTGALARPDLVYLPR